MDAGSYLIRDGNSAKQQNSWDCGVFSVRNMEKYIFPDDIPVVQGLMKFYRLSYLRELYRSIPFVRIVQGLWIWLWHFVAPVFLTVSNLWISLNLAPYLSVSRDLCSLTALRCHSYLQSLGPSITVIGFSWWNAPIHDGLLLATWFIAIMLISVKCYG